MKETQDSGSSPNEKKAAGEAPVRFKKVTKRQRQILKERLKYPAKTQKEIADKLGVKQGTISQTLNKPHVKAKMSDILDQAGVTDEFIAKKVHQLQNAKKKTYFASFGKVIDSREDDDGHLQLAATNLAAELKGHKHKKLDLTSGGETIKALLLEDD